MCDRNVWKWLIKERIWLVFDFSGSLNNINHLWAATGRKRTNWVRSTGYGNPFHLWKYFSGPKPMSCILNFLLFSLTKFLSVPNCILNFSWFAVVMTSGCIIHIKWTLQFGVHTSLSGNWEIYFVDTWIQIGSLLLTSLHSPEDNFVLPTVFGNVLIFKKAFVFICILVPCIYYIPLLCYLHAIVEIWR